MKKLLISILIIGLLVLAVVGIYKGIKIGHLTINSVKNVKEQDLKLNEDLAQANELANKTYAVAVDDLENAIKQLKISKQEYESKKLYANEEEALGTVEVKTYTLHYLWTILGNYRKDEGIKSLTLELKSTTNEDVYDLDFTLTGKYTNIIDFLYDIENNKELNFEISNFKLTSNMADVTKATEGKEKAENKMDSSILPRQDNNYLGNHNTESTEELFNEEVRKTEEMKEEKEKKLNEDQPSNTEDKTKDTKNNSTVIRGRSDGTILKATFTIKNIGIILE